MDSEVLFIKLDDIIPNRFQPREVFDEEELNRLADSIKQHGVLEPIIVRPVSNKFEIIAGERRYKASVLAGLTKIPAMVKQMDDKESSIVAFVENEHRADVSAIEEARTISRILTTNNMKQEELASALGINQSTLSNKLRLLNLPNEVQEALMRNEISERHARSLLTVKDAKKQIELLNKIKEKRMTVRELDSEIKSMDEYLNNNNNSNSNEFKDYYNNNGNVTPVVPPEEVKNNSNDDGFMNFLNNYDNNNPVPAEEVKEEAKDDNFMNFLNNYDSKVEAPAETVPTSTNINDNIVINDVSPASTNVDANSYIENNPNYVDVSKQVIIDNVDEIINKLKSVVDEIKNNSKFKVDTDEINYDDIYQITIKIDKRDF